MFYGASKFNADLSKWDVSAVKDMSYVSLSLRPGFSDELMSPRSDRSSPSQSQQPRPPRFAYD